MSKELEAFEIAFQEAYYRRMSQRGIDNLMLIKQALTELEQLREEVEKLRKIAKRYDLMTMGSCGKRGGIG